MNKPFIIKANTLISQESDVYSEVQEKRIQILQAANGYLAINMLYESFKLLWQYFHWQHECSDFAYLSLGFLLLNVFWAVTSIYGFRSINSKNSRNIAIFGYTVIANLILRIGMYILCGVIMTGYITKYSVDPTQKQNAICNAIYPRALFILQGVIEGLACVIILYLEKGVAQYVKKWQKSETKKYIPKTFNNVGQQQ